MSPDPRHPRVLDAGSVAAVDAYVHEHRDRLLAELFDLLRIPSVSTDPGRRDDVRRAAEFLATALERVGLEAAVHETPGHPIVTATSPYLPAAPTVLVYGHYDVQPAEPLEAWHHPPFEPVVVDGEIRARGASDDKGQVFAHVKAVEALRAVHGALPVNLRFVIEGEEEIGSPHLAEFLREHRDALAADVALVSDGAMVAPGTPTITYGLRGMTYLTVRVRSAGRDLHSGSYGGGVPNPLLALSQMLASLKGDDGRIRVDGFYDDVVDVSDEERARFAAVPFDRAAFMTDAGVRATPGEEGYSLLERLWARPTLDVHGMAGGYVGAGAKTVIPAEGMAKLSCRLVAHQDPQRVFEAVRRHLEAHAPEGVDVEVTLESFGEPALTPLDTDAVRATAHALETVWGQPIVYARTGGSIPVIVELQRILGATPVLLDMGLEDDRLHAPNEKFAVHHYLQGIRAAAATLLALSASATAAPSSTAAPSTTAARSAP
jgi:acetylornithine deacetylase/succinyl-diaminopimelate desuccinylase-like protein